MFTRRPSLSLAASIVSSRQIGTPHQKAVHRVSTLAALSDGPHHKRLTAAHIARGKYFGNGGVIGFRPFRSGLYVAARIFFNGKLLNQSTLDGTEESHRKQHQVRFDFSFGLR